MNLEGKVAIVTGGTRGIGFGIAKALLAEGAKVAICGSRQESAEAGVAKLKEIDPDYEVMGIWPTLNDPASIDEEYSKVVEAYDGLDILVNNAGISASFITCLEMTQEHWDKVINLNLTGLMFSSQWAEREMAKRGGGRILNIASVAGITGGDSSPVCYAASKGGVIALTRYLSNEFCADKVSVNTLALGVIKTDIWNEAPDWYIAKASSKIRVQRMGEPDEIGRIAAFLCSDDAEFIEGVTVVANGGVGTCLY